MRLVFFGTPEIAVPLLAALHGHHEIAAVVCQPDRPQGRSLKLTPPPVKAWALEHGVAVVQPEKLNDGLFERWLREQSPDLCPIAAYGRILKQPILDVPRHGFLNFHPSLLPLYRGPSPIQSALLNGDAVTGVTIMRLCLEMDAGDIQLQERVEIAPDENAGTLSGRLSGIGATLMLRALSQVQDGTAVYTPQDHARAVHCRMFSKSDGFIRWRDSAQAIHNRVRASNPWPAAQCWFRGMICKILESEVVPGDIQSLPGTVVQVDKVRLLVATGNGLLSIKVFQVPGKKAMPIGDFLKGHTVSPGDYFLDL